MKIELEEVVIQYVSDDALEQAAASPAPGTSAASRTQRPRSETAPFTRPIDDHLELAPLWWTSRKGLQSIPGFISVKKWLIGVSDR